MADLEVGDRVSPRHGQLVGQVGVVRHVDDAEPYAGRLQRVARVQFDGDEVLRFLVAELEVVR